MHFALHILLPISNLNVTRRTVDGLFDGPEDLTLDIVLVTINHHSVPVCFEVIARLI